MSLGTDGRNALAPPGKNWHTSGLAWTHWLGHGTVFRWCSAVFWQPTLLRTNWNQWESDTEIKPIWFWKTDMATSATSSRAPYLTLHLMPHLTPCLTYILVEPGHNVTSQGKTLHVVFYGSHVCTQLFCKVSNLLNLYRDARMPSTHLGTHKNGLLSIRWIRIIIEVRVTLLPILFSRKIVRRTGIW